MFTFANQLIIEKYEEELFLCMWSVIASLGYGSMFRTGKSG
ncbi:hypothetical protein M121_1290 [Bacteroides fragilis str. 3783N2-1]|nr:hypothetical protein M121_1290 [Bacteroides fragilis str. 3783N2-1]